VESAAESASEAVVEAKALAALALAKAALEPVKMELVALELVLRAERQRGRSE